MVLVVCQLSRDVMGYEDCKCDLCVSLLLFSVIIVVSLTLKKIKSANLNLPATQFNSRDSVDFGNFFSGDSRTGRDLASLILYRVAKFS